MNNDEILQQIPKFPQTQESVHDQLKFMRLVANKLGCYDAADYLRNVTEGRM
jgi:hypothetical protein